MRRLHRFLVVLPFALLASCGAVRDGDVPEPVPPARRAQTESLTIVPPSQSSATTTVEVAPAPPPESRPGPAVDPAELENAARLVEPGTELAALVIDRRTGVKLLSHNADVQFRSASIVKLLIAIDCLQQGAGQATRAEVTKMLSLSDDHIASVLWVDGGMAGIVKRTAETIGLTGTEPPAVAGQWGQTLMTAGDIAMIYDYVLRLPEADRALILDALANAPRHANDGFDQHFGIPDGMLTSWAIKQGWGNNETAKVLHSTGLAGIDWRYEVILLTEHPISADWSTSAASVTAAADVLRLRLPDL